MKNGDRLTGSIVKFDGKKLTLKSDYAGTVDLTWDAVSGITSSEPLNLGLQDGQVVVGTVTTTPEDQFAVKTKDTGIITAPRATVQTIRSNEEQAAYEAQIERYQNPSFIDLWAGSFGLGFAKTAGDSKTTNLNINAAAVRATRRDTTSVYFTSLYAKNSTNGPVADHCQQPAGRLQVQFQPDAQTLRVRRIRFRIRSISRSRSSFCTRRRIGISRREE